MTPARIRSIRAKLGLTQSQLAHKLYMTGKNVGRTVRRWESGDVAITGPAQKALEQIEAEHDRSTTKKQKRHDQ